jgi:beta-phosphoglucomutase
MEKNKLKAIIFDLDGVITDSARYHYLAWKELADELHIPFDEEYNEKLKGISRMESLELILQNAKQKQSYSEQEKAQMTEQKNDNYKELIKQITPKDILPGIMNLLQETRAAGIKIALASVSKNAEFILKQLEIEAYFDYVADAASIPNSKPFPDIFLAGIKAFGLNAEDCVGVEDARAGVEAIHRAGMKAVGVGTANEMEEADLILTTEELTLRRIKEAFEMV